MAQWWEGAIEFEQALAQYLATLDGEPIGYVQSYQAAACHADGWWLEVSDGGS